LPSRVWALELEGAYFFEQSVIVQQRAAGNEQANFALLYGGLSFCWLPELAPSVGALACGGADVGAIASSASGFDSSQTMTQSLLLNLVGKGGLSFRVGERWLLLVGGDVFVPLWRSRFQANPGNIGNQDVFRLPVIAGAFELGIALEF
jgi:hypothetical protein